MDKFNQIVNNRLAMFEFLLTCFLIAVLVLLGQVHDIISIDVVELIDVIRVAILSQI